MITYQKLTNTYLLNVWNIYSKFKRNGQDYAIEYVSAHHYEKIRLKQNHLKKNTKEYLMRLFNGIQLYYKKYKIIL